MTRPNPEVHREHGDRDAELRSDSAARASAVSSLGEPPKAQVFSRGVVELLATTWLPKADPSIVDGLTVSVRHGLSGAALAEPVGTKAAQIRFLRTLDRLRREFRSAFVSAHKDTREVPVNHVGQAVAHRPGSARRRRLIATEQVSAPGGRHLDSSSHDERRRAPSRSTRPADRVREDRHRGQLAVGGARGGPIDAVLAGRLNRSWSTRRC